MKKKGFLKHGETFSPK